eukprot:365520-Chlamydomonas_euryale.AAC.12
MSLPGHAHSCRHQAEWMHTPQLPHHPNPSPRGLAIHSPDTHTSRPGVTQPIIWRRWLDASKLRAGLIVATEVDPADVVMRALMLPVRRTYWASIGIVDNTVRMLNAALEWYPDAQEFFVVSGDSIPAAAPPSVHYNPAATSCTSAVPCASPVQFGGCSQWYTGSQWIRLVRADVVKVIEGWQANRPYFLKAFNATWNTEHGHPGACKSLMLESAHPVGCPWTQSACVES